MRVQRLINPLMRPGKKQKQLTRLWGQVRVLVVEDNDDMRALISRALAENYRIVTACNGHEGLEAATRLRPDLIVSDVMMPGLNGMEMLKQLRERAATRNTPVILVTARTGTESVVHGLELGATDYVTKPFHLAELQARIDAQLRSQRMREELDERETRLAAIGGRAAQVAHDLRSPYTAILLRLESLKSVMDTGYQALREHSVEQEELNPETSDDLISIKNAVRRASKMTDDLMALAKGDETQVQRESIPVSTLTDALYEEVSLGLELAEIDLVIEVDPPELTVSVDPERMLRVLSNLVNNAREALTQHGSGRKGRIWVQAYTQENNVVLRVADNGPGVPQELRESLFQAYQTLGKVGGTGLGLAIATNIVESHQGKLQLENSSPEGGAAFRITLDRDQSFWESLVKDDAKGADDGDGVSV